MKLTIAEENRVIEVPGGKIFWRRCGRTGCTRMLPAAAPASAENVR